MKMYLFLISILFATGSVAQTMDAEQIYKKVNDAVVTVYACNSHSDIITQGSGVVLNDKGWVVTNYHVYNGADKLIIKHNGKLIEYTDIIGVDVEKDILILKIADHTFSSIKTGNSDLLNVGQRIYAIGSPEGFENTITEGIISGLRSYKEHSKKYIQISAPISHGSSGGAIVNSKGELIGISTSSVVEGQNLNFAIPVNEVLKIYKTGGVTITDLTADSYFYKGLKDDSAGKYDDAIVEYKKAIDIDPNYTPALLYLGIASERKGKYDDAIFYCEKTIAIDPNDPIAYYILGSAYGNKGDERAEIACLKKSIAIDPTDAMVYYSLGLTYELKGRYRDRLLNNDTAITYLKKAIALEPTASSYLILGEAYDNYEDHVTAMDYFKKAIALDPKNDAGAEAEGYLDMGVIYDAKQEYDSAIASFKSVIEVAANGCNADGCFDWLLNDWVNKKSYVYQTLGQNYLAKGDYRPAISCFKKAIAFYPFKDQVTQIAGLYISLGAAYTSKGDFDTAIYYLNKGVAIDPHTKEDYVGDTRSSNNAQANCLLGEAYRGKGDFSNAVLYFKKSLLIDRNADAYLDLGEVYYLKKDYANSISSYEEANLLLDYYKEWEYNKLACWVYKQLAKDYSAKGYDSTNYFNIKKDTTLSTLVFKYVNFELGKDYQAKGDYDTSIQYLEKASITIPQFVSKRVYLEFGRDYKEQGNTDKAISYINKAISIDPNYAEAYYYLGESFDIRGDRDNAKLNFDKAYQLNPTWKNKQIVH